MSRRLVWSWWLWNSSFAILQRCQLLGPSMKEIEESVAEGFTPLVCLTKAPDDSFSLTVFRYKNISEDNGRHWQPYAVILHVWSQGIGNSKKNELPLCQLLNLHHMIGTAWSPIRMFPDATKDDIAEILVQDIQKRARLFWMDTLCLPRDKDLKRVAIAAMKRIY